MIEQYWHALVSRPDFWGFITIAPVAAFVTWIHVWMALKMVFYPVNFWGIKIGPLPIGWQGIVPRKAGKISGIIVDQTLSKLGSLQEFFHAMDPAEMADMISEQVGNELEHLIDELMLERNAVLWENLPYAIKRRIYAQAHKQMPNMLRELVTELTYNVENLVDMREMIVTQMENDRSLMVRMFLLVGKKEIDFIWHMSFFIGLAFGILQMGIWLAVPWHSTIIFWAGLWGLLTNWIAIWMVFNPVEPVYIRFIKVARRVKGFPFLVPTLPHIGTYTLHGAFMRRQAEVSEVFAHITTRELITLKRIMTEMMYGSRKQRTRRILKRHINTIMETPLVRTTLQMSLGMREYAQLKTDLIDKSIEVTMVPISDPALNESRANKIFSLFRDRIASLTPKEFQNLLRPAFIEDEWILIVLGGLTGALAGYLQYIFGFK
jgi:uncharacterized membrane protein YheB (UPF0754 family)